MCVCVSVSDVMYNALCAAMGSDTDLVDGVLHEEQAVLHRVTQVLHKRRRLLL